jgi:hypothetical protein
MEDKMGNNFDKLKELHLYQIVAGCCFLTCGIVITATTYSAGGNYIVMYGAIGFGLFDIVRGMIGMGSITEKKSDDTMKNSIDKLFVLKNRICPKCNCAVADDILTCKNCRYDLPVVPFDEKNVFKFNFGAAGLTPLWLATYENKELVESSVISLVLFLIAFMFLLIIPSISGLIIVLAFFLERFYWSWVGNRIVFRYFKENYRVLKIYDLADKKDQLKTWQISGIVALIIEIIVCIYIAIYVFGKVSLM